MDLKSRILFLSGIALMVSANNIGEKYSKDPVVNAPVRMHGEYYKRLSEKREYAEITQDYYLDLNDDGQKQENESHIGEYFYIGGASPHDSSDSIDF